jgi:bifunctional DNase/RNase
MRVKALSPNHKAELATIVLGAAASDLALGFVIPMNEANRLARVLGLTHCRCVPVYELILDMLARLGASVIRAVLDAEGDGICARLIISHEDSGFALPSHPGDAIALACRMKAPIYATRAALAHACPLGNHDGGSPEQSNVARWLEQVSPDDFRARDNQEP